MIEILHDFIYQNPRNSGGIVYRSYIINNTYICKAAGFLGSLSKRELFRKPPVCRRLPSLMVGVEHKRSFRSGGHALDGIGPHMQRGLQA